MHEDEDCPPDGYYTLIVLPEHANTTTVATASTTTVNYSSFNSISSAGISSVLSRNSISVEYSLFVNYPFFGHPENRTETYEVITYNKSKGNQEENILIGLPPYPMTDIQSFYINGTNYICSFMIQNNNSTTPQCSSNGNTYPTFLDLSNRTYLVNANGMILNFTSQLKFTDQVTVYNSTYGGYQASYFHANLSNARNSAINGNITVYTSMQYGVPILSRMLLHDPVYNSTNDTIIMVSTLMHVSRNVTTASMMPQYLANAIRNGTA